MSNQTEPMPDGARSAVGKGLSSVPAELAEQLVAQAREQGIALTGPGGLLSGLTRQGAADRVGGGADRAPGP
jgi:hypothetical protein